MKLISILAAAALALSAVPTLAQTKLTLGHGAAPGNPRHEAAVHFANVVKQKSGGKIEVQVAPSAQLGDDAAMLTALRSGSLDMSANSQGATATIVPEFAAFGMPFLFTEPAQAFKLLDGPLGKELADKAAQKNLVVLGYWDNGIRHVSNSKKPVLSPADMKGLKIRTPPDAVTIDIMTALARRRSKSSSRSSMSHFNRAWSTGRRIPWRISTLRSSTKCRSSSRSPATSSR